MLDKKIFIFFLTFESNEAGFGVADPETRRGSGSQTLIFKGSLRPGLVTDLRRIYKEIREVLQTRLSLIRLPILSQNRPLDIVDRTHFE